MENLIEIAAKQRARIYNESYEQAFEYVKDFQQEQLEKIAKSYFEHQDMCNFIESLYERFEKGTSVKENIKKFKPEIDSKYNFTGVLNQIRERFDDLNVIF